MNGLRAGVTALLLAATLSRAAAAQDGSLSGVVREAGSGAPVTGAVVTVTGARTRQTRADAQGAWRMDGLAHGVYAVRVAHPGYATSEAEARVPGGVLVRHSLTPRPLALDAVVATAGRRLQTLSEAVVATEVVTGDEIRRSGASDLATVLAEQTGIQLQGGHPTGAGVMLQGMGQERILVLVDGQPYIGRIAGELDLSRIPVAMVERVEVVKGPQSTLYGNEAMGGVINVVTRSPAPGAWGGGLRMTAGTQARRDGHGDLHGAVGAWSWTADAGRRTVALAPGRDGGADATSRRWDGGARLRWTGAAAEVEARVLGVDERQRWREGQLFHFADNTQWSAHLGAVVRTGRVRWQPSAYATAFEHLPRRGTSSEPAPATAEAEVQRLARGELLWSADLGPTLLDGGVEVKREAIRSERVEDGRRTQDGIESFAQATWTHGALTVVPGVRVSHAEPWGSHASPRLAVMVRPVPSVALRASAAGGYRAPAFKELYIDFLNATPGLTYAVRGNPRLQPEASRTLSFSAEWAGERAYVRANGFHTRFDDFIETTLVGDEGGVTVYTYGNVANGRTSGVEVQGGATAGGLRAEAGYAWLTTEDDATGLPLLGRPSHSGRLALSHALPVGLRASVAGVYTGATPVLRSEAGVVTEREGHLRMDGRVAMALPRGLEVAVGADNLLGDRPAGWPGFTGRHVYVTLGWAAGAP